MQPDSVSATETWIEPGFAGAIARMQRLLRKPMEPHRSTAVDLVVVMAMVMAMSQLIVLEK